MANNIKGITIEIGGSTSKLDKALTDVNKSIKGTQTELKEVEKLLKLDPKNTELLAQKQELLADAVSETKDKLDVLKTAEKQVQEQFKKGEATEEQYRAVQREIIATEEQLKSLEDQAKQSNISLADVGEAFEKAGGKITAVGEKLLPVTAAIGAIGAAGIAAAMELDDGYDTIITKTGATGEKLEELTAVADSIFANMPTNMDKAGTAVGEVNTRFGITGASLEDLSEQFIKFSEINGTDLNNSIGKVDKIMEQWNIDMSDSGNILGFLTKKGQDTGISVDALMDSVQKNGATFKEMGLGVTQSIDLLAQFEANGVNADTAIAGLRKSMKIYTDQGKSVDEALTLTIGEIKDAKTETEALAIAQEVFGTKGAAEMSHAIREGRIDMDDLSTSMAGYGTVVEETFAATLDPWDEATIAANNLKLAGAELGSTILTTLQPVITQVVEKAKEFSQWFTNLNDTQKETILKIAGIVAAIGPALGIFGKLTSGIGGVVKTVSSFSGKIGGIKGALAAITGPVGIVIAVIAALAAGFVGLYRTNDEFKEKVDNAIAKVKTAFEEMWVKIQPIIEQLKEAFMNLMNALQPVFEFILELVMGIVMGAINALEPLLSAVKNAIDFVTNIINAIVALLKGDTDGFLTYIQDAIGSAIEFVKNILQAAINFVVGFFDNFGIDIQAVFQGIWDGITTLFSSIGQWFTDRFTEAYNGIVNVFSAIGTWFGERWTDISMAFATVSEWFKTQFQNAWQGIKDAFANVVSFFTGLWESIKNCFVDIGTKIGAAVGDAFKSAINTCLATIENIINKFIGLINGVIGIINEIPGVSLGEIAKVSLPRLAHGGILKEGQAMVAEAGPELLSMVNGKAVVTPLTGNSVNRMVEPGSGTGGGFTQTNYITSPKALSPYETGRQIRMQTRSIALAMQRG